MTSNFDLDPITVLTGMTPEAFAAHEAQRDPEAYPYIVNGDANDLDGWTAETLAAALTGPLAALNVIVECRPLESGLGGAYLWARDGFAARVEAQVEEIVSRIIQDGPAASA